MVTIDIEYLSISLPKKQRNQVNDICIQMHFFAYLKLFLSVAGGRTHIGTYVGDSPSLASNENNLPRHRRGFCFEYISRTIFIK